MYNIYVYTKYLNTYTVDSARLLVIMRNIGVFATRNDLSDDGI